MDYQETRLMQTGLLNNFLMKKKQNQNKCANPVQKMELKEKQRIGVNLARRLARWNTTVMIALLQSSPKKPPEPMSESQLTRYPQEPHLWNALNTSYIKICFALITRCFYATDVVMKTTKDTKHNQLLIMKPR